MSALRLIVGGAAGGRDGETPASSSGLVRELYEKHAPAVFARCRYLLRDDEAAKDAMQEVFAKALRALPEFRAQASPSTWLQRIATYHCLNELRAGKARWRDELKALSSERRQETESPDRRELLRALLSAAEPEAQEIAVMTFVDEMTQAEIAETLGRSLPTVRKRLREFLAAARAALAEALPGITLPEEGELP